jgi:hypothetical protein
MGLASLRSDSASARSARSLSIRARLMILALIAIVPIVLERVHNEQFNRSERIDAAYQQALSLAQRAAAVQNDLFVSARAILSALASTHAVTSGPSCRAQPS